MREYKYLGTPLQIGFEGRHTKMRKQVVSSCSALLRQIGRVDMLGPRQTRRCMELAMAGVMGYFARSTPLRWADCHAIEQVRVRELARRKHTAAHGHAAVYLAEEAGGAGHTHQLKWKVVASLPRMENRQGHSSMVALQSRRCMEQQAACLRTAVHALWWMVRVEEA